MDFLNEIEVGEKLRELRMSREMTQEEFGAALGLDQSIVSKIENGTRGLSARDTVVIEMTFGLPSASFVVKEVDATEALLRSSNENVAASLAVFRDAIEDFFTVEALAGDSY